MSLDPISDMFAAIKNAQAVKKETVNVPFSKMKFEIVKILQREGFIESFEKVKLKIQKGNKKPKPFLKIKLKYDERKVGAISDIKIISKPGQRIYLPYKKIKKVKGGYGIAIISTSKGIMTDKEARKQKVGGEVICEIW
jgi:small subunit ribosomal protein S8